MGKRSLLGIALGVIGLVATAAEVQAQQLVRVAEVESVGGYTTHNDKATFWADMRLGRVRGGLIQVERDTHHGTFVMTGRIDAAETLAIWNGLAAARPWRAAQVHALAVNVDFPDTVVTYLGRYRQTIRAGFVSLSAVPRGMPAVSS